MDSTDMVIFPAIFIAIMQFVFATFEPEESQIDIEMAVITNATMWTSPDDPKYDTFFGNDPIGWFVDNTSVLVAKLVSGLVIVGLVLLPVINLASLIPVEVVGTVIGIFVFLYAFLAIGLYKTISPFVGGR